MAYITWTKSWSSSDDGSPFSGADIQNIQNDITSAVNGGLDGTNYSTNIVYSDGAFVNLSAITHDDTSPQGLRLPQIGASPASPSSGEGYIGWDQTNNTLEVYDGSSWVVVGNFGTPALTLGTANVAGSAVTAVRTDATILAFDATAPTTQAFGDSAAAGTAAVAARRDHTHGMPTAQAMFLLMASCSVGDKYIGTLSDLGAVQMDSTNENDVYFILPACKVKNLRVVTDGTVGAGESVAVTFRDDTANTALTCTIGVGQTTASDTSNIATVAAGSLCCFYVNETGTVGGDIWIVAEGYPS